MNQTENELIEEMGNVDGGSVDITLNDLSKIAGLGNDENYTSSLKENFPKAYAKGRYESYICFTRKSPNLFVEPSWNRYYSS